jgi:GNAT superfamily N-acetyltransferase
VHIVQVDPCDERSFAQWFAVVDAVDLDTRPGERQSTLREQRAAALDGRPADDGTPPPDDLVDVLVACDAGRVVGAAWLEQPLRDNTQVLYFTLRVLPDARRRGVGAALLEAATARCSDAGRTVLMTEVDEPPGLERRSPGRALLERSGFTEALVEVRRDLALPVDPAHLDAVDAACRPRAAGYALRTWPDRCPDDLVDDRAELGRQMSLDVPLGELSWEEESWDAGRVRRREELVARQGRTCLGAGAVDPTGAMVAFTEVAVAHALPERVHQWETFVLDAHRGRRLGTLVKTAVLRRVTGELPQARTMSTTNADSNRPMIAVNEVLGFRPNGLLVAFQRRL